MSLLDLFYKLLKIYKKQNWWPVESQNPEEEIIIGAILTQNTSWKNVEKAIKNLIEQKCLDFNTILNTSQEKLEEYIKPSGFYKQKTKTIYNTAKFFLDTNGKIITRDDLLKIKGIGKETADSILLYALNQPYFIIDTYTKRLLYRLGYTQENIFYEELQEYITKQIPLDIEIYKEFHALIVVHCKTVCKKKPLCNECNFIKKCHYAKIYSKNF